MGRPEHVVHGTHVSEHYVQLFDSKESLASTVAAFLYEGYQPGDTLLVLARESNWIDTHRVLRADGVDVEALRGSGRLIVMNAVTKLAEVSRCGLPNQASFDAAVGEPVRALAAKGPLRIYGEVVDVLAELDELDAAIALEDMWNRLAEQVSFRLMCGYSSAHFVSHRSELRLPAVCGRHSSVRSDTGDPLGGWLLQRSQLDFSSPALPSRH